MLQFIYLLLGIFHFPLQYLIGPQISGQLLLQPLILLPQLVPISPNPLNPFIQIQAHIFRLKFLDSTSTIPVIVAHKLELEYFTFLLLFLQTVLQGTLVQAVLVEFFLVSVFEHCPFWRLLREFCYCLVEFFRHFVDMSSIGLNISRILQQPPCFPFQLLNLLHINLLYFLHPVVQPLEPALRSHKLPGQRLQIFFNPSTMFLGIAACLSFPEEICFTLCQFLFQGWELVALEGVVGQGEVGEG